MIEKLNREQLVDLLNYLGSPKIKNQEGKKDIQYCCLEHGESNPSAGINIETNTYNCFSCHAKGDVVWLTYKSSDEFKSVEEAENFLIERYNLSDSGRTLKYLKKDIRRYEDKQIDNNSKRNELKKYELGPYKSGEETYKYFFDRGFTIETMKKFNIGRDLLSKTITIPLFWENNTLAGIIGRYIDPNRPSNQRYKIYNFSTGNILYPLNNFEVIDDSIILVEGILDSLYMHQLGYRNTLALLTNFLSKGQLDLLLNNYKFSKVIDFTDNDKMGIIATKSINNNFKHIAKVYSVKHLYPQGKKDPQDCTEQEIEYMLKNKKSYAKKSIVRI